MMISDFVPGEPIAQPRIKGRIVHARSGPFVQIYTPATAKPWKERVQWQFKRHVPKTPLEGPIGVSIVHHLPRPASHYGTGRNRGQVKPSAPRYPTGTPDVDNLFKSTTDALTDLGLWRDDALIVEGHSSKIYSDKPGALIRVWTVE